MKVTTTNITQYLYQTFFKDKKFHMRRKYELALRKAAAIIGVSHEALRKWWTRRFGKKSLVESVIGITRYRMRT
ncbi:hypothetical protein Theth_0133 [Pseudothermotoga thermarum DSM 5069]|uniref:Uncharacterized protein n=1 Tax=Pseudothermotoga thermarum DSM 5069 TaxID=688269 RepID=F7YUQ2_9THEM|nr:hypothetical protein Theth_0133 [Pseudothermotoga thermarum DSM 5069]